MSDKPSFTDTLKTWHEDPGAAKPTAPSRSIEFRPPAAKPVIPPMPESPVREFADHMDAARQNLKDWVRKELHLLVHGVSHEDRVKENP